MKKVLFCTLIILVLGCDLYLIDESKQDLFFVRNNGADMPVLVSGNKQSGTFVIFLHGGPGGTAMTVHYSNLLGIEDDFAVVYYDQRASGSSQGTSTKEQLTVDQFVDDCDAVIEVIRYKYNNPDIFLLGHSWGGFLGTAYLLDSQRQAKIKGWIDFDGGHDFPYGNQLSREWVMANIQKYRQEALNWYYDNPVINRDNFPQHAEYVQLANGYVPEGEAFRAYDRDELANYSNIDFRLDEQNSSFMYDNFDVTSLSLTSQMHQITIPTLIIWGQHDGILPVDLAQQAYDTIGTPPADKYLEILPNSGHFPVLKDQAQFEQALIDFINAY